MVKTRKNQDFNLEYYRSKYFVAYHLDNPAIEKKVDDMLVSAFSEDMSRFYDALLDAQGDNVPEPSIDDTPRIYCPRCGHELDAWETDCNCH